MQEGKKKGTEKMKMLISACLLGTACRYDGKEKEMPLVKELASYVQLIPICPEQLGGLATPRVPSERRENRVVTKEGVDVTLNYEKGAKEALRLARFFDCKAAVLKERSPSCGHGKIYDGSFTGTLTEGDGVCAELLCKNGIRVYGESEIERLLSVLNREDGLFNEGERIEKGK